MDLGYSNDVTAIVDIGIDIPNNAIYIDELCYKTRMLTKDIVSELKGQSSKIWSESADPRMIDEIYNAGINIHPVEKGPGSVKAGIDKMKGMRICITMRSFNILKEFKNYTYKQDKTGKFLNDPVDDWNHAIDAIRYVVLMEILGKNKKKQKLSKYF
jgi:phage terminase large subunit